MDLLETPWALVDRELRVRFANSAALRWLALDQAPETLADLFPELVTARAKRDLERRRRYAVEREVDLGRGPLAVEFRIRPFALKGEELLVLEGSDQSRAAEKQVMLEQFSRTIEINNRQLAAQRRQLDEVNVEMRRLLDNIYQGVIVIGARGSLESVRSAAIDRWIGPPTANETAGSYLGRFDSAFGAWFDVCLAELQAGILPREVLLDTMPKSVEFDGRWFELTYRTIDPGARLLVVITDVSERVARERTERVERELLSAIDQLLLDRTAFGLFLDEASELVRALTEDSVDILTLRRLLHTLKGNCAMFGIESISEMCHEIENVIAEEDVCPPGRLTELGNTWSLFNDRAAALLVTGDSQCVRLQVEEYQRFVDALVANTPHVALLRAVTAWRNQPARSHLDRLARHASALAVRLERAPVDVTVESNDVRLAHERWAPIWAVLTHVVRNAIDHGLESTEERSAAGKPATAKLLLSTRIDDASVVVEVTDDGRGIDWARVAEKARCASLPADSSEHLHAALLAPGFTTRSEVTELSGRGIGLAAVKNACDDAGAHLEIESRGVGTTLRITVPT
jgi:two-component system, chemotaxis family, sensor kinase CheA